MQKECLFLLHYNFPMEDSSESFNIKTLSCRSSSVNMYANRTLLEEIRKTARNLQFACEDGYGVELKLEDLV